MAKHKEHTGRGRPRTPKASRASMPVPTSVPDGGPLQTAAPSFQNPVARVLDGPHLVRLVPHLAPETLHGLIRHSGLHACGELVAAATPGQVMSVFDLDLWRHPQPGRDEQFDADRFGEWLEVLVETGGSVAARIVAALDHHLVIAGLSRYIRVFDPAAIAPPPGSDDEWLDADVPSRGSECEVGGYLVRAIRADAWDAIVTLLVALEAGHRERFQAVMRGCRRLSGSPPEVDGLDNLLHEPEQLFHDVAADREHRQSRQGYISAADARAFLQLARQRKRRGGDGTPPTNPLAAAYFRAADASAASLEADVPGDRSRALEPAAMSGSLAGAIDAVVGVLAEAGLVPQRPRALLEGPEPGQSSLTHIRPLMRYVHEADETAHFTRSRELAFLANTLMAGCSVQSRPFTPQEASDAVVGICNLGLEHWPARWPGAAAREPAAAAASPSLPEAFLVHHDLVTAFEVGWAVLHEEVSLFVAEQLIVTSRDLRCADPETRQGLAALRRELARQRETGTPWHARDALAVLMVLDMPAWAGLTGLLDECPVLPDALTATLEGHTGAVSATSFTFISTTAQIEAVRAFMRKLPDVLRP